MKKQSNVINEIISELPAWTKDAGGTKKWAIWIKKKAEICAVRARKCSNKKKSIPIKKWREEILKTIKKMKSNNAAYSGFPLDLSKKSNNPMYPSLEHINGPLKANVVIETRLVNDMKTILNEKEFYELIAHITKVKKLNPKKLPDKWRCIRDYA